MGRADEFHFQIAPAHPFGDGQGRQALLEDIANQILGASARGMDLAAQPFALGVFQSFQIRHLDAATFGKPQRGGGRFTAGPESGLEGRSPADFALVWLGFGQAVDNQRQASWGGVGFDGFKAQMRFFQAGGGLVPKRGHQRVQGLGR